MKIKDLVTTPTIINHKSQGQNGKNSIQHHQSTTAQNYHHSRTPPRLDMAQQVKIFWPDSNWNFFFFLPEAKTGWSVTRPVFFAGQLDPTCDPTRTRTIFFKTFFFWVKKIVKLRQYWFNCLLWALRKQLKHLHNCMQINWKINGWAFCNE